MMVKLLGSLRRLLVVVPEFHSLLSFKFVFEYSTVVMMTCCHRSGGHLDSHHHPRYKQTRSITGVGMLI